MDVYRKRKRRKNRKTGIGTAFVLLFFLAVAGLLGWQMLSGGLPFFERIFKGQPASLEHGWNLILVNRENYIPDDYDVELTELSNGEKVDSRIYPYLQEMFDAARADGLELFVAAGYRTWEEQQRLLDEKTEAYEQEGHSASEAEELAEEWVALPGTSEHQLGLAVDINADKEYSSSDAVYDWLAANAYRYGFIRRYPPEKTSITGIIHEPWHYRYVGAEAAAEIQTQGLCLEEYVETLP